MNTPDQQSPGARLAERVVQEQQRRQAEAPASQQEVRRGFQSIRQELYETQRWLRDALVRLACVERALEGAGRIPRIESDTLRRAELLALSQTDNPAGLGLRLDGKAPDKYEAETATPDCANRLAVCRAVCCYLPFPLAKQDVDEGEVAWSVDYPFQSERVDGRRCAHLDPDAMRCTVYDKRPRICRIFDCRSDKRVWRDYERRVLTPWAEKIVGSAHVSS